MNNPVWKRLLSLGVLFMLFLFPLSLLTDLAGERKARADEVVTAISGSSFNAESVTGPLLVLPYRRRESWTEVTISEGKRFEQPQTSLEYGEVYLPPDTLNIGSDFSVETRNRQIYEARQLHTQMHLDGTFTVPSRASMEPPAPTGKTVVYEWLQPRLAIGISDPRGIGKLAGTVRKGAVDNDALRTGNAGLVLEFQPGDGTRFLAGGVHAPVPAAVGDEAFALPYALEFSLSATGSLTFVPVGKTTQVHMKGDWPHPSFFGNRLPVSHKETDKDFSAIWQSTLFATGMTSSALGNCENAGCPALTANAFGVRLVDPVDRYLMTDRTIKYAALFLLLTFGACFVVEILRRVRVHPVQYGLVGGAQAVFFLLVLALAEHMAFSAAYATAATATVLLLSFYSMYVFGNARSAAGFGVVITLLYGMLWIILDSEDNALLLGSVGLFAALALVMVLTRKVDWYGLSDKTEDMLTENPDEESVDVLGDADVMTGAHRHD